MVNHPVNRPNDVETSLMMTAFTNKSSTSNVVSPNPALAELPYPSKTLSQTYEWKQMEVGW